MNFVFRMEHPLDSSLDPVDIKLNRILTGAAILI